MHTRRRVLHMLCCHARIMSPYPHHVAMPASSCHARIVLPCALRPAGCIVCLSLFTHQRGCAWPVASAHVYLARRHAGGRGAGAAGAAGCAALGQPPALHRRLCIAGMPAQEPGWDILLACRGLAPVCGMGVPSALALLRDQSGTWSRAPSRVSAWRRRWAVSRSAAVCGALLGVGHACGANLALRNTQSSRVTAAIRFRCIGTLKTWVYNV